MGLIRRESDPPCDEQQQGFFGLKPLQLNDVSIPRDATDSRVADRALDEVYAVCMYIYMCMYVYICMCVYVCMYIYTHVLGDLQCANIFLRILLN